MTEKNQISIAAFVSEGERPAVESAAPLLARALSQAADAPWRCDCVFSPDLKTVGQNHADAEIIVTSLLPEVERNGESWPHVEQRLRKAYATLGAGGKPVFICTVLRHIGPEETPETAAELAIRIRRLNLLAAEISRETGVYVIDLDRVLADIGARRLQTDYRLAGKAATGMVSHVIALTLVNNAFDALVPFEVQDAAKEILASGRPAVPGHDCDKPAVTLRKDVMSVGQGRRKQIVSPVSYTVEDNYAGWLVRQVLRGTIGPADALQRLVLAVRRRGIRESLVLLAAGLSRQINRKK